MNISWTPLAFWILVSVAGGLVIFHVVAGFYHLKYYVLRSDRPEEWKCQEKRFLPKGFQKQAALLSSFNMFLGGLLSGVLIYCVVEEGLWCPVYVDAGDYHWTYTVGSTVFLFVLLDAIAFYDHWALHHPWLYKRFHRFHHRFVATTPYVTTAIHPVAFVFLHITTLIPLFLMPFHVISIAAVLIYILIFNIIDHSGVSLKSRIPWQASSNYHDDHHVHFHVNFGQHLQIWDKMHGTLRRENRKYGREIFGGKGQSLQAGDRVADFVKY